MPMLTNMVEEFRTYWSACPEAVCLLDRHGCVLAGNGSFALFLGESPGVHLADLVAFENRAAVRRDLGAMAHGESSLSFVAAIDRAQGDRALYSWRVWHTGDDAGSMVAMATRVESRHIADAGPDDILRAHQIVDTSPTFVVAIDAIGTTVFMNSTMLRRVGYSRDEVIGRNYMQLFVPEREHALLAGIFQRLSTTDKTTLNENHIVTRRGEEVLVEWHGQPMFDGEGRLEYFYGVGFDVTEQRRTQNALLRSQQRFALHFKQSPLGMIEWNRDFQVTDWNPAAERIFGYSREEALGKYGQELVVPEPVRPYVADIWQQLLDSRGAVNAHNENVTKDGRTIICEWSNTTLVDANDNVVGVASLVNDVTDRKKIEEDLRERERMQAATIQQLSVPIIDVWDGVMALPIVGAIDETRAVRMTEALLEAIVQKGTRFAILDLTGASATDGSIANHLGDMIRATRLVGSECLVSGLGPALARTLVELDTTLSVRTFGSLRAALRHAIRAART